MRYCGNCGAELDAAAISSGVCPTCGITLDATTINAPPAPPVTGDLQQTALDPGNILVDDDPWGPTVPLELRLAPNESMSLASARPTTARMPAVTVNQPINPLAIIGLGVGLGVALLLVLVGVLSVLAFNSRPSSTPSAALHPTRTVKIGPTATDAGLGFATQVSDPTPLPYTAPSPLPTDTPYGGIPTATDVPPTPPPDAPTTTPPDVPTATPVTGGGASMLVVTPLQCAPNGQGQFAITAAGADPLTWQATADKPVNVQPASGTLAGGQTIPVTVGSADVTGIHVRITVVANPGNQSKPVRIDCGP